MTRVAAALAAASLCSVTVWSTPQVPASARPRVAAPGAALPRTVLALYDGAQATSPRTTPLHALVEMPLGYLGLLVRYHDIRRGLPTADEFADLRGVVTWFASESLPDPRGYLAWLETLARRQTPLVVIGSLGAFSDEKEHEVSVDDVNRVTRLFGWRYESGWNSTTYGARYITPDQRFIGFERPLPIAVPPYGRVFADGSDVHVALRVEVPGRPSTRSDLVLVGPRGSFVAPGFAYFSDRSDTREFRQWYINPFELFRSAFSTDALPKPDATTLSGRRIYYSHVDGDGWRNVSQIEPYRTEHIASARVVLEQIVRKAPDLPVSIGPIVGDLDPAWQGSAENLAIATAFFAEPQVEAAIHTYSHPFDWRFFATPRTQAEERAYGTDEDDNASSDVLTVGPRRPRMYDHQPFSIATEVNAAAAFVNRHLPAGKRVQLLQWPGDTRVPEAVLARTREAGLANINGGDTRFDREFPSAAWVAPLGLRVGREFQVYASNSNENTYTDLWRDRFFGFSFLTRTVENTGAPRRLKPFNIYYHMYSGERLSSLNAVQANIAFARKLPLAPIEASRFSRIANGFVTTTIEPAGVRRWRVRDRGALQTIRFDDADTLGVDFAQSVGVIGQRHELGSLYVALDEQETAPVVALKTIARAAAEPVENAPYLVESRWRISSLTQTAEGIRFRAQGFGDGEITWRWPSSREALVSWRASSGRTGERRVTPSAQGLLELRLPASPAEPIDVTVTLAKGGRG